MNLTLKIWRQKNAKAKGGFENYKVTNISPDCSFLEMLDILNESLIIEGKPFHSTMTAVRVFAEPAVYSSMADLMDLMMTLQPASFICVNLKMVRQSLLNPGVQAHFLS